MTSRVCVARKASADDPLRCAVLISGSGTGMEKLILHQQSNPQCGHQTVIVISDKKSATGLSKADDLGIDNVAIDLPDIEDLAQRRLSHETLINQAIEQSGAELVILSGYMRILTTPFVEKWTPNLVNIHPSLLPHFPGADAHGDVIASTVEVSGCTVHFVDSGVDSGAIIAQCRVPRFPDDDAASLSARVRVEEHRIYPLVIDAIAQGRVFKEGDLVTVDGDL
jgi:phosphoribosylglycinamide formyltransferase-1